MQDPEGPESREDVLDAHTPSGELCVEGLCGGKGRCSLASLDRTQQADDKGARFNRRNLSTSHALLLERLRYKAEALGILVVTTEESYASETAFALNEPLRVKERRSASHTPRKSSAPTRAAAPAPENSETRTDAPSSAADVDHPSARGQGAARRTGSLAPTSTGRSTSPGRCA